MARAIAERGFGNKRPHRTASDRIVPRGTIEGIVMIQLLTDTEAPEYRIQHGFGIDPPGKPPQRVGGTAQ